MRRNLWQFTEDLASNRYAVQSSAKQAGTMAASGVTLTRWTSANFYGSLRSQATGLGLTPFTPGGRYLVSLMVHNAGAEQFVWMRPLVNGGSPGHGMKLLRQNATSRIWMLAQATSTGQLDLMPDATVALGTGAGVDPHWIFQGNTEGGALDVHLGGFQIEAVAAGYKDGIALIGDSTMEGSSGAADLPATNAREVSVWLGAFLNVPVFNRANGGERTDNMDARWAADITPLAANCKYAVIQGGINDIGQGRALVDIQASVSSMVAKAQADGLIPVLFTCTPTVTIGGNVAMEAKRQAFNAWLVATFPNVIDIAAVVADPGNPAALNPAAGWFGDGTHYVQEAKRAVGLAASQWAGWAFTAPSGYQPILADTFTG